MWLRNFLASHELYFDGVAQTDRHNYRLAAMTAGFRGLGDPKP